MNIKILKDYIEHCKRIGAVPNFMALKVYDKHKRRVNQCQN